jgi:hypothetical protein
VAEWGTDMQCFGTASRLSAWTGVARGNDESAGKRRSRKTRQGNRVLRAGLTQMAHAAARRGKKRAIMAVAHAIVVSAFSIAINFQWSLRRYPSPMVRQHPQAHGTWAYGSEELDRPEPAMPDGGGGWWPLTQQGIAFRDRSVDRPFSGASRTGLIEGLAGS